MTASIPIASSRLSTVEHLRQIARRSALAVMALGLVVLVGWSIDSESLTSLLPGWASMKANTALCFVLSGLSLFLLTQSGGTDKYRSPRRQVAFGCALAVIMVAAMTELEYFFGFNFHIDELLFGDNLATSPGNFPGRMSPISAFNFLCMGGSLVLLAFNRAMLLTQVLASCVAFLTLLVLTGTSYGLESLHSSSRLTVVALHTNLGFCLLCAGILCASGRGGMMRLLTDPGAAGTVVRRLIPTAIIVPLVFGRLSSFGQHHGLFGTGMAVSIFSISTILMFVGLVWWSANFLRRTEAGVRRTDAQLRESLERYAFLAEAMPQIVWTTKADGNVDYFNQRWFDYTGLTLQETRNWGWERVLHPDDLATCLERWSNSLKTGCTYDIEYRLKRADGSYRWHLGRAFPMRNEKGDILHWVGTCTDIDEQKQTRTMLESRVTERTQELAGAKERLEKSRQQLDTILNSSLDGVIVYESVRDEAKKIKDLRFVMINPAAERLMRQDASELLGHTLLEKFPLVGTNGLYEKFARIFEEDENQEFEHMSAASDPPRWYRIAGVRLGDGLVISYTEITARKEYERQLEEAKERAESADRAKGDFLATMSHEIRTPMNGVMGMTGLLLDTRLDTEQRSLAETIRASAESLLTLINDILDFSKIEAGKLSFEELSFDLRKVVEDTLEVLAGQAQAKGVELVGGVEPEAITKLRGDPGRLQQLLTNLIGNAIKFTSAGEVSVRVMAEMETALGVVAHVEIKDTGIGISPEIQGRLFQPFVQAESSTSRRFGGTGLGLAICKRLAQSMNGSISVKSTPGEGSTFGATLRFIRQPDALQEEEAPPEFAGTHVLIVDDNGSSRKFLRKQIIHWGMRDSSAHNGIEALKLLRHAAGQGNPYPIAILDLHMPETNGLEFARKIHADPQLTTTKVILLTPFGKPVSSAELKKAAVAACCAKPVRQSALFDCLTQVLNPRSAADLAEASEPFIRTDASVPLRHERLLLAEDNAVNQRVALGNLRILGFNADVAASGLEVLDALEGKTYDVILMDCQMPELDGYEATKEIRQREKKGHRTWIIAMTANVMVGDREKCLAAGMDDYVSKPLRREDLRAALERAMVKLVKPPAEDPLAALRDEDEDELAELIDLFVGSAPKSIFDMKKALEKNSASDLAFAAHTLKGSCGNLGKFPLYETCVRIEQAGREGDMAHMPAMVADAEKKLSEMIEALKSRRKT